MNELSLFSGAGGGLLGTKLLGWRPIGYVEWNDYCQRVIAARIKDGMLDNAPIFTDIKAFVDSGCAEFYRGITDVITGGFPCQDISCAGKGKGIEGERSGLWKTMAEVIRIVRPTYALVENSPMLVVRGLGTVLRDLAEMGYNARWGVFSGKRLECGHGRERIWIFAYTPSERFDDWQYFKRKNNYSQDKAWVQQNQQFWKYLRFHATETLENYVQQNDTMRICRGFDEVDYGVDRLKAIGNGQISTMVKRAWEVLSDFG